MARKLVSIAVVVVVAVSVWRFGAPYYTVEPTYTDHLKHAYDSWAFLQVGFRIFTEPVIDWNVTAAHPHLLWEFWPHPYPPGAVLLFLPFGVASQSGLLPDLFVHWLMVTLLGAAAVWAAVRFARMKTGTAITILVAVAFLHWGLNGFYDPLVAGLAVWAIDRYRRDDLPNAVILFTAALGLHYRTWYLAPVAAVAAWRWYRKQGFDWRLAVAAAVGVLSVVTFTLTTSSYLTLTGGEGLSLGARLGAWTPYAVAGWIVVTAAVAWFERSPTITTAVALAGIVAFTSPQFHDWYTILLAPLFVLATDIRSRGVLLVAWLHLSFPNLLRLADYYAQAVR